MAEAFYYLYTLENACKVQVDVMASGATMKLPDAEVFRELASHTTPAAEGPGDYTTRSWDALIRMLDAQDPSYKN